MTTGVTYHQQGSLEQVVLSLISDDRSKLCRLRMCVFKLPWYVYSFEHRSHLDLAFSGR